MPIGTIWPYVGDLDKIPTGWHLCDGTESTPDLRDRFLQSYGTNAVMQTIEPGLPNIKGSYSGYLTDYRGVNYGMVNSVSQGYSLYMENASGNQRNLSTIWLDAEAGRKYWHKTLYGFEPTNDIFGNSQTVQPPAYTVYYIIKMT